VGRRQRPGADRRAGMARPPPLPRRHRGRPQHDADLASRPEAARPALARVQGAAAALADHRVHPARHRRASRSTPTSSIASNESSRSPAIPRRAGCRRRPGAPRWFACRPRWSSSWATTRAARTRAAMAASPRRRSSRWSVPTAGARPRSRSAGGHASSRRIQAFTAPRRSSDRGRDQIAVGTRQGCEPLLPARHARRASAASMVAASVS
jgi:hypothetical protein